jgi:hypothetical protein
MAANAQEDIPKAAKITTAQNTGFPRFTVLSSNL